MSDPDVIVVGSGAADAAHARRLASEVGTVTITSEYEPDAIHQAIVAAAQECGVPFNPDYNGARQDGISYMQFSIKEGIRQSTTAVYLHDAAEHPNLSVLVRA